jgi:hypothetical protein
LVEEAVQPFRFLDIACGDARATVGTLKGSGGARGQEFERNSDKLVIELPSSLEQRCQRVVELSPVRL